jgi:DNA segregation ATPase FtsK/SpoIIIE, S-DNA-T family
MAGGKIAPGAKTDTAVSSSRAYAMHSAELNRPYSPGDTAAAHQQAADDWRWIALAGLGLAAFIGYTTVWPALRRLLYTPCRARDYLLVPSTDPVYVIAGVGVGWFWVLFIAAPVAAAAAGLAWWALLAWSNHRARAGHLGHVRAGQAWIGEQYPAVPLSLAGAAAGLAAGGAVLRWAGAAAQTVAGRLLVVALLCAVVFGFVQLVRWARARATITTQLNKVTFLASPVLGWPDLRAGRVRVMRCCYPRRHTAFPKVVTLVYSQHPRSIGEDITAEVAAILFEVTGHTYSLEHDALTRVLYATESMPAEDDDSGDDAETVLAPLVASWFDAAAHIASVTVDRPAPVLAGAGALLDDRPVGVAPVDDERDERDTRSAQTANDAVAARIQEFTVGFVYNLKVSSAYRRGLIEGMVSDSLGGSWEADWSMASRRVRFVRSPGLPSMIDPPLQFPHVTRRRIRSLYASTTIPFGIDAYGNIISWDFTQSPHMLISGQTASGKTSALTTISTQCTRHGFNVVWIDPKAFDSPGMRDWPNVSMVTAGTDEDGLVGHTAALRFIADTMRDRLSQVKVNPNRADDFDPIIVITDEFSNLVVALAEFHKSYATSKEKGVPPTTKDVGILLRTARAVAIHMAIGIQRPDTMFIAGEARDNTALRVAMGRLRSKDAAIMMFNDPVAGTRVQPGIKGRGTVQLPDGGFREMQAFYTPKIPATEQQWAALSDRERAILDELRNVDSFWPRRVVDSALRGYDPGDPQQAMSFAQIRQSPVVLAADRPDLDPVSAHYEPPASLQAATMDDEHAVESEPDNGPVEAVAGVATASFGAPVDGFDDDYLPGVDDEYGPTISVSANELTHGDLVEVSIDGVSDWKYVHAEPYLTDDVGGHDRLVICYRDLDDSRNTADIDVDPYEVMQVRKLHMH